MVNISVHPPYPMDLFGNDPTRNLLPRDGTVNYFGPFLSPVETSAFYQKLLSDIPWKNDEAVIFGNHIITARKVAWYGDTGFSYTYSGTTKQALPWTSELATLKTLVEKLTATRYNSCLLNLYHDGNEGMAWHSDDERSLGKDTTIASVSFGAEREFRFKHKRLDEKVSVLLESGSLLVMKRTTQTHWLHCIPKTRKVTTPRINLTFRTMLPQ
jgi:alkylated DNA repair dioxygenase AlkB